jgi:tripartite-type tricarboxylate transporter receptor subunit TctC
MRIVALAVFLLPLSFSQLSAQSNFYEGKTINIVVGLPAGGAYDLYARMLATSMGKYIPGNPNIMVQIMPGASSMITATMYIPSASPTA